MKRNGRRNNRRSGGRNSRGRRPHTRYKISVLIVVLLLYGCVTFLEQSKSIQNSHETVQLEDIPDYDGEPYVVVNDNVPEFDEKEITDESFEEYSRLDELGRCGTATASIGQDLMPTKKRESIGQVKPSGWHTAKYDNVDGKYLYNRCHLIGYQLTAENANERNLVTGTRYMNVEGMLPFENMVADYIRETDNHVMYRVEPVFEGDNLVASGVQMEAYSVEDEGEDISFNVFVYNVQPGVEIDYETGDSWEDDSENADAGVQTEIRGNMRSKVYHCPGQDAYDDMADSKNLIIFSSEEEAQRAGYRKAKK